MMYGGSSAPAGWLICDGQSTNSYGALAAVVGQYVPDLRDKFIVGAGSTYSVGNTGGESAVTLTLDEIPAHKHDTTFDNKKYFPGGGSTSVSYGGAGGYPADTFSMSDAGGGQSHNNLPPYYALIFIIKT